MNKLSELKKKFDEKIDFNKSNVQLTQKIQLLKTIKNEFLGKNGFITNILKDIKNLSIDEKKKVGLKINNFKKEVADKIYEIEKKFEIEKIKESLKSEYLDSTLLPRESEIGLIHPITKVKKELLDIFQSMGFTLEDGPEIETDWYNFESLNVLKNHPSRQMQDTFYIPTKDNIDYVLRTQTTAVSARGLISKRSSYKFFSMGKVFRRDYDATHLPMFQQIDAVYVGKDITLANLKSTLINFCKKFFEINEVPLRFRPSYFPFTTPSIEVDIKCTKQNGQIVKFGEGDDWCEILGGGILHPKVIENAHLDPNKYQGFAFGMGIERISMLKYGITDMRYLYEGDIRFLKHYSFKFYE